MHVFRSVFLVVVTCSFCKSLKKMPQKVGVKDCPSCAERKISSRMRLFQLSFDKAVLLCCKKDCLGGFESLDYVDRNLDEIRQKHQPRSKKSQSSLKNDSIPNVDSPASSLPLTSLDSLSTSLFLDDDFSFLDKDDDWLLDFFEDNSSKCDSPRNYLQCFTSTIKYPCLSYREELSYIDAVFYCFLHNSYIREAVSQSELESLTKRLVTIYCETLCKVNEEQSVDCSSLDVVREEALHFLSSRWSFLNREQDKVVAAFPLLATEHQEVKTLLHFDAFWLNECHMCGTSQSKIGQTLLPSFDQPPVQLKFPDCFVSGPCARCKMPRQKSHLKYQKLPESFAFHFVKGLPHSRLEEYDFEENGHNFRVTAFIQDKGGQWVTWVRHLTDGKWMNCQKSEDSMSRFSDKPLDISPYQIRIVMWEKCKTPESPQTGLTEEADLQVLDVNLVEEVSYNQVCDVPTTTPNYNSPDGQMFLCDEKLSHLPKQQKPSTPTQQQKPRVIYFRSKGNAPRVLQAPCPSGGQRKSTNSKKILQPRKRKLQSRDPVISPVSSDRSNASDGDASIASGHNVAPVLTFRCAKAKPQKTYTNVKTKTVTVQNSIVTTKTVILQNAKKTQQDPEKKIRTQEKLKSLLNGSDLFGLTR